VALPQPRLPDPTRIPDNSTAELPTQVPDPTIAATLAPDLAALCPPPVEGNSQYISTDYGYCFVYPNEYELSVDQFRGPEVIYLAGPVVGSGMEAPRLSLWIEANGPADGLDAAGYASNWQTLNMYGGETLKSEPGMIGELFEMTLYEIPGMFPTQAMFVTTSTNRYIVNMGPSVSFFESADNPASQLWQMVTGSMRFFPPSKPIEVTRAEDVCPQESAGYKLYVNLKDGYCLLYPDSFSPDPTFPGNFTGGPGLGDIGNFKDVYESITVGTFSMVAYDDNGATTPRSLIANRMDTVLAGSDMDTTIGGYPAVVTTTTAGPWYHRTALIVSKYWQYSIVADPWDEVNYPGGYAAVLPVWDSFVNSLRFFTPFR
jgi:hypothetical protein